MPTVDLPQGTLKYQVAGPESSTEPPVVFIHPILTDGQLWAPVAERLEARGVRSYAPDWPLGSHMIPLRAGADRSPAGVAKMVRDFLVALDLRDVTLVGNDTGGAITQYVLDSGDPRVARAVLMNCDAFDTFPPFLVKVLLLPLRHEPTLRLSALTLRSTMLRHSWLGFGLLAKELPAGLTAAWIAPMASNAGIRDDLMALLRNLDPRELLSITNRLGDVQKPTTVLWGMADKGFRPALGRRLAAQLADTKWIEVPGARTLLALDAPGAVRDAIVTIAKRT